MLYNARTVLTVEGYEPSVYWDKDRPVLDGGLVGVYPAPPSGLNFTVESSGGLEIVLQEGDGKQWRWDVPGSLVNLVGNIKQDVILPLDGLIP
jgi:hypothetical protein